MNPLDDPERLAASDPSDFLGSVEGLPAQVREGWRLGMRAPDLPSGEGLRGLVTLGMGGSGISGDVCRAVLGPESPLAVQTVKGYRLPGWVGPDTLVVAASYSGNTEETLEAFEQALERRSRVLVVATGGRVAERAAEEGLSAVRIPAGLQPRAAVGYLALPILAACSRLGLAPDLGPDVDEAVSLLERRVEEWGRKAPADANAAKGLALRLAGKIPVVYGGEGLGEVAAYRFKCQLNECGKVPAFSHVFSELNHNEIVGWDDAGLASSLALIVLRHAGDHPRVARRIDVTVPLVEPSAAFVEEVEARGASRLARLLDLFCFGDFVSTYLALARGVDPAPVRVIEELKRAL